MLHHAMQYGSIGFAARCVNFSILAIHARANSAYFILVSHGRDAQRELCIIFMSRVLGARIAGRAPGVECESRPHLFLFTFFVMLNCKIAALRYLTHHLQPQM